MRGAAGLVVLCLLACGSAPKPAPPAQLPTAPPDSLALMAGSGVSVWFTDSRPDRDSTGTTCVERVLQIRRDSTRIPVPLLYTGRAPVLIDDSTMEAELWLHCRAMDRYRVDLRTGRPTRVAR